MIGWPQQQPWPPPSQRQHSAWCQYGLPCQACLNNITAKLPEHPPTESEQHKSLPEDLEPEAPDQALDLQMDLEKVVGSMTKHRGDVVRLVMAGYTRPEICRITGLTPRAVKEALKAGRAMIQMALEVDYP